MDWLLLVLRVAHVGGALIWFGGAFLSALFLDPTARALGPSGAAFMQQLLRRGVALMFPIVATVTIVSGIALYWRDSGGLQAAWIGSPAGLTFTIGGLAAIGAFVGGMMLIGPSEAAKSAVHQELAASGAAPTAEQQARLDRADASMRLATRIDLPLLTLAALTMAIGRYVT